MQDRCSVAAADGPSRESLVDHFNTLLASLSHSIPDPFKARWKRSIWSASPVRASGCPQDCCASTDPNQSAREHRGVADGG